MTAITTHPESVLELPGVTAVAGDANDREKLPQQIAGHDAVISSIRFLKTDHDALIASVKASGVARYFVAGGTGTLLVPGTTTRLIDTPEFPEEAVLPVAAAASSFERIQQEGELNWTFLSPPPGIGPGERTGVFRVGRYLIRRLRDRDRRRAREPVAAPPAVHRGLLTVAFKEGVEAASSRS